MTTELRAYDYVNQPYETVCAALAREGALDVLRRATKSAATRGASLVAALRIEVAGIEIQKDVSIAAGPMRKTRSSAVIPILWNAAHGSGWFPVMLGELRIYPLSPGETQLEIHGRYSPPLGAIGHVIDAAIGHRIAEASVHTFASDVAAQLREELRARAS